MSCQACRNNSVNLARAEADVRTAARKAIRFPNARNIADIDRFKERLAKTRAVVAQHEQACEELVTVP